MATLIKRNKALTVEPVKAGQHVGAALAMQGLKGAIPMFHGSQGCTAFAKVFLIRHFREPIPLQTTAMDQISTVLGGDDNIVTGLATLARDGETRAIGLVTTGLTEIQGSDIHRVIRRFRAEHPELARVAVIPVNTPDFSGALESGFGKAVLAMLETLALPAPTPARRARRINILAGAHLTPAEMESVKDLAADFGLEARLIPDLSESLDGHLADEEHLPVSPGGTPLEAFADLGNALGNLTIGSALTPAADRLAGVTGNLPELRLTGLMGLAASDRLVHWLSRLAAVPVPPRLERERRRYLDALLDCHFILTGKRIALAGDPDFLLSWHALLGDVGVLTPAVVASIGTQALKESALEQVKIGDLEDLAELARHHDPHLFIGNAHVAQLARRLERPVLRAGYPVYDRLGAWDQVRVGYAGGRRTLFELSNRILAHAHTAATPYRSRFSPPEMEREEMRHAC